MTPNGGAADRKIGPRRKQRRCFWQANPFISKFDHERNGKSAASGISRNYDWTMMLRSDNFISTQDVG